MTLTKEEKQKLIMGKGAWNTHEIEKKVKSITMNDGPHGLRKPRGNNMANINNSEPATCFPCEASLANSWNQELSRRMGTQIAREAAAYGTSVILGCGVNIKRSPLCGRNFEYFSEDPFLAGKMAASYIRGAQSEGIGTSLKHFAGNNQESCRMISNSQIDERALREIYLRPFEIAIKESNPSSVMASYNYLNGIHATENKELLTDILRKEWNYQGLVVSDWGACTDPVKSHEAGMDLEMPENKNHLNAEVKEPALTFCASNVIRLSERFQKIEKNIIMQDTLFEESHSLAEKIQCESAVLLKNDGILPLSVDEITVIGNLATEMRYQGGGSSHINATHNPNAVTAFTDSGYKVTFFKGYKNETDEPDPKLEEEVLKNLDASKPVIFVGGLPEKFEGEGFDRKTISIPDNQIQLIKKISASGAKIIFVNISGSAVEIPFKDTVNAILHMALGGQASDTALVKLISGKVNPSGKLSETFPENLKDTPCFKYFGTGCDIEYRESVFVGYRYYSTFKKKVAYPFGHGLSYTTFSYCDAVLEQDKKVSFRLTNTGNYYGKEVCQVYIKNPKESFIRPEIELAGFTKVALNPKEEKLVSIELNENAFKIWDVSKHSFVTVGGTYEILIGASSEDIRCTLSVKVNGNENPLDQKKTLPHYFTQLEGTFEIPREEFRILYGKELTDFSNPKPGDYSIYSSIRQLQEKSGLARFFYKLSLGFMPLMFKGKKKDDPEVVMCMETFKDCPIEMVAAQSGGLITPKAVQKMLRQANRK